MAVEEVIGGSSSAEGFQIVVDLADTHANNNGLEPGNSREDDGTYSRCQGPGNAYPLYKNGGVHDGSDLGEIDRVILEADIVLYQQSTAVHKLEALWNGTTLGTAMTISGTGIVSITLTSERAWTWADFADENLEGKTDLTGTVDTDPAGDILRVNFIRYRVRFRKYGYTKLTATSLDNAATQPANTELEDGSVSRITTTTADPLHRERGDLISDPFPDKPILAVHMITDVDAVSGSTFWDAETIYDSVVVDTGFLTSAVNYFAFDVTTARAWEYSNFRDKLLAVNITEASNGPGWIEVDHIGFRVFYFDSGEERKIQGTTSDLSDGDYNLLLGDLGDTPVTTAINVVNDKGETKTVHFNTAANDPGFENWSIGTWILALNITTMPDASDFEGIRWRGRVQMITSTGAVRESSEWGSYSIPGQFGSSADNFLIQNAHIWDTAPNATDRMRYEVEFEDQRSTANTFRLSEHASDLSGGADFDNILETTDGLSGFGNWNVQVASGSTEVSYGFTEPGIPGHDDWDTGDWTVKVNITSASNKIKLKVRLTRVNSSGSVQESTSYTSEQDMDPAAVYTFNFSSVNWSSGAVGDRIRVDYSFRNTDGMNSKTVTLTEHFSNQNVTTPIVGQGADTLTITPGDDVLSYMGSPLIEVLASDDDFLHAFGRGMGHGMNLRMS